MATSSLVTLCYSQSVMSGMISNKVKNYYLSLWGEPSRKAFFSASGVKIEVYKWDADKHPDEVNFYATLGMSDYIIANQTASHRMEMFIGFLPEEDRIAETLASVAARVILEKFSISHNYTITLPEPLWTGTELASFLFSDGEELLPTLHLENGLHTAFFQIIPMFMPELEFKKKNGVEALFEEWEDREVAYWNPARVFNSLE